MELTEIGKMLREAREQKGLTIAAVEDQIKIGQSVIVALEEGNKDRFPHPVYARGFLRSYALLLNLDASELSTHFSREYPLPPDAEAPETYSLGVSVRHNQYPRQSFFIWIIAIVGVLVLGVGGWYFYTRYEDGWGKKTVNATALDSENQDTVFATTMTNPALPQAPMLNAEQESIELPAVNASETQGNETLAQASVTEEDPVVAKDSALTNATNEQTSKVDTAHQEDDQPKAEDAPANQAATPQEKITTATVAASGNHTLIIKAHAASWLQARPDDSVTDYFLRKGESATINFSSSLTVKFGNAGGVTLELDGQPYPFDGESGEVRTLIVK